jgi:PAS domain S-box-containing protein
VNIGLGSGSGEDLRGALSTIQDAYARKALEEDIYRLAAIVESSDDAIVSKNLDGIVMTWNSGAERLFGYAGSEMRGKHISTIIPEDRLDEETIILSRIRNGERIEHYETIRRRRDGSMIDVSLTVSPIRDSTGQVIGASKIARDITHLKAIENELRMADQRKNEFLATLAHELRGPLAPIQNSLGIMRLASRDTETYDAALAIVDRQLRHMSRLIDDLLDIGRITSGKLVLRKERVDALAILREAVDACQQEATKAGHTLSVDHPPDQIFVQADSTRLTQVFSNLLSNAVKYTPQGGNIGVTASVDRNRLIVSITDDGLGIPPEKIGEIFELFMQVERSLERTTGGLGIGLTLAQRLIKMHGGQIEAHSEGLGRGSRFTVEMPIAITGTQQAENRSPNTAMSKAAQKRILVVDDNVDSATSLAMMLKILGHETRKAHDGLEAVDVARSFAPEIILMDIGMPKLNGFDACRRIRAEQPDDSKSFIVALTGWGQHEARAKCKEAGFDMHLVKPVELQALAEAINR